MELNRTCDKANIAAWKISPICIDKFSYLDFLGEANQPTLGDRHELRSTFTCLPLDPKKTLKHEGYKPQKYGLQALNMKYMFIGKILVPLGWYPSCLTPQGAL